MNYGSLPPSIARSLPNGEIEPTHRPDGLTEADIDAMAAAAGIDLALPADDEPIVPVVPLRLVVEPPARPLGDEAA